MLRLVALLTTWHIVVSSQQTMIITYGQPLNSSGSTVYATDDWEECVVHCYKLGGCVLAASPGSPVTCRIYMVNQVYTVKKLTSSDDLLVAFKVLSDGSTQNCPVGENPPTFGNFSNQGFASYKGGNYTYQVNYQSDNVWEMSYTGLKVCPNGWTNFSRPMTDWCMMVFGSATSAYTYAEAEAYCESQDAVLSGLETTEERDFSSNTVIAFLGADYPLFAAMWVAGVRKPECTGEDWPSIDYCNDDVEQFTYTDKYLTNYAGYTWDPTQPDRNESLGVWQNCIQVWIRKAGFPDVNYTVYPNGNSDDTLCDNSTYPDFTLRAGVCGKLPQVPIES